MKERTQILKLTARNVKSIRAVEIDEFGEVLEIRGDTGQGKTSILEAIEAGLNGLDPSMVRKGQDSAEIILELDSAKIQRITQAEGGKEKLIITDSKTGQPIQKAKEFLRALCSQSEVFRPLDFVLLGGGDSKGKTERLRQQRTMLLDAVPVTLSEHQVRAAISTLGETHFKEAAGVDVSGIDYSQHAIAVCASLRTAFYDARKSVNAATEQAENMLTIYPEPKVKAPNESLASLKEKEQAANKELYRGEAERTAKSGTLQRKSQIERLIADASNGLNTLENCEHEAAKLTTLYNSTNNEIQALEIKLQQLRNLAKSQFEDLGKAQAAIAKHEQITGWNSELIGINEALAKSPDFDQDKAQAAYENAKAMVQAKAAQEAHDAYLAKANACRERSKAFDDLVNLFRDTLPKQIIESMKMPIDGLGISDDVVTYKGVPLHQLGTSEQLKVGVLIAAALNPNTGFILIDRAESLGSKDRAALAAAAHEHGLQLIMTFVDALAKPTAGTVVMQDGQRVYSTTQEAKP